MNKNLLSTGIIVALFAVIAGAFGAHALKKSISANSLLIYETAVRYQFYHALALILTGILYKEFANKFTKRAGQFFILGILLFSGSLYILSLLQIESLKWIGAITPIGGLFFMGGWFCLAIAISKKN